MKNFDICLVKKAFFDDFPNLKAEGNKKEMRLYLGIRIKLDDNNYFIPFESKLFDHPALKDTSQYSLPSSTRPNAGLNFEKCLIINDLSYIEILAEPGLAHSQYKKLVEEQDLIIERLEIYIQKFIKACEKKREKREFMFKFSTLHEFKSELGVGK